MSPTATYGARKHAGATSRKTARRSASRPAGRPNLDDDQVEELLLQALETEQGGIQVYETAIQCADSDDLREEWEKYLEQTREHERILLDVFDQLDLDPERSSPGREIVGGIGRGLVAAMEQALDGGRRADAQLVAAECVVLAETKDHANWELIGAVAKADKGTRGDLLAAAHAKVEEEEDEHLYHTTGWARELWFKSLGLPAVLPPSEEKRNVKSAIGAARARQARKRDLPRRR